MRRMQALLPLVGAVALAAGLLAATPALAATTTISSTTAVNPALRNVARSCAVATTAHQMACFALRRTDVSQPPAFSVNAVSPDAIPAGYGPANLQSAYKLPNTGGTGATVAIVDAFDDPVAESDLATYRAQFGLPACTTADGCFKKVNQNGATSPLPPSDTGWAGEISLDVDMVSAICPNCHILLVEANSASDANLYVAEDYAAAHAGYVSNSWGGPEYGGQTTDDAHFNHKGVVTTASTGDDGTGTSYPATSQFITAVGGTSLNTSGNARGWTESAWSGAGSGCSTMDAKPSWQTVTTSCTRRAEADVSAVADPNTGVAVFQSFGNSGWAVYGGTSASAPIIASVYALAGIPGAADYAASYPYAHQGNLFDVTAGNNGSCAGPICTAGTGWDGPTGLGTPNGTAAFTGSGASCSSPGQKLGNPGFETGTAAPWRTTARVVSRISDGETAHTGSWYAWLVGYGTRHTDTASQSVTIPAGCSATLSFWLKIDTAERTGSTQFDRLTVKIGSTILASYSNLDHSAYTRKAFDVSSFAGQTVTITFTGIEDGSLQTSFVVDDTALTVS
jgi:hypothetical protein